MSSYDLSMYIFSYRGALRVNSITPAFIETSRINSFQRTLYRDTLHCYCNVIGHATNSRGVMTSDVYVSYILKASQF